MKNIGLMVIVLLVFFTFFVVPVNSKSEPIFSIQIIDFQSPVKLGGFLEFSYLTKGILDVNGTAEINFLIEKDGKVITSGSDTIYLGGSEERIRTARIFLPTSMESGIYNLKIGVNYQGYIVNAHRTIEIKVKGGVATINSGFGKLNIFIIIALAILIVLNIGMIYRIERKKIKKILLEEERFIKRHKEIFILILSFFAILGILVYYLNLINFLPKIPLYFYYLALGILLLLVLFFAKSKKHIRT